ncbi:MAG TPA: PilZ domain-containing protein, partial [Candidatus Methanoperedens sp.]|nr:PilZ domain-containing protein [Candidatus Methanoperedens sp.]
DLVIVGDAGGDGGFVAGWQGPLLVLEKGRAPERVTPREEAPQQLLASSSIDGSSFLALTSRLLGVSERRLFRAVIGVRRVAQAHGHMGASREFSLTGLSFSLPVALACRERILISFYIPNAGERLTLEAEVARSFPDPEDGSSCYGARFVGLSDADVGLLRRFVWAEH